MSNEIQEVRIKNSLPTSLWDGFWFTFVIVFFMGLFGCDDCKGTKTTMACMGKIYKSYENEFKEGYNK